MSNTPKRIQRKRTKGWRMPEGAVYVGRGSVYGNPWSIEYAQEMFGVCQHEAREMVVVWYRDWLKHPPSDDPLDAYAHGKEHRKIHAALAALRGKNLACWCPLDKPCHADVLLEIANADSGA